MGVRTAGGVVVTKKVYGCNEEGTCQNYRRCGCDEEGVWVSELQEVWL